MSDIQQTKDKQNKPKLPPGTAVLIGKIEYLDILLQNLRTDLPEEPLESIFYFSFDEDDLEDGGHWMALNRCLEKYFQRHLHANEEQLTIKYRSSNFPALIKLLKLAVKGVNEDYQKLIDDRWISRITAAAKDVGGKRPPKKPHAPEPHTPDAARAATKHFRASTSAHVEYIDSDDEITEVPTPLSSSFASASTSARPQDVTSGHPFKETY